MYWGRHSRNLDSGRSTNSIIYERRVMIIQIELDKIQGKTLEKYATKNGVSSGEYATSIIASWINSHIQGFYIDKIKEFDSVELETKLGKMEVK